MENSQQVEQWGMFEAVLQGTTDGNPFKEVQIFAKFSHLDRTVEVEGFYDGDGTYRVRFMPDAIGKWSFSTSSNDPDLHGNSGFFDCVPPTGNNHGPVRVDRVFHFAYEDGSPYRPFGTTSYAWIHQSEQRQEQTIATLRESPFNKLRMCLFPKRYLYNLTEPEQFPFAGAHDSGFDFTRFNSQFFSGLEHRISQLADLGIEADLILFHPYDKGHWGFDCMQPKTDIYYLRYVINRLSAYRNVWWSLANEYDFMKEKKPNDWDTLFKLLEEHDPYQHLRSIHNGTKMYDPDSIVFYDHAKPWVTHASIQHWDLTMTDKWTKLYDKPVVIDECCYEGNIARRWGNLSGEEMTHRFWEGMIRGGYVGHGETFLHPEEILWWSHGGELHGTSPERIEFLRAVMEELPIGSTPLSHIKDVPALGVEGDYYLFYFGIHCPAIMPLLLDEHNYYKAEIMDTWNMTIKTLDQQLTGACTIPLPGRPYIALRITKA